MPVEAHILAQRLGRDLDALTGARLLMETVGDREVTATMLRLVIRHGQTAAMRARALLAELSGEDGRGER
ncbi:hypothetical protein VSR01_25970 [Actinacidiphila sp. DG2A-62]|uniref:hypothetical protein n=1 Tax=Actinacidiphila sp. DG2A-62 TaxID=3108821 RepID=UPI002DBB4D3F|nr:hypothetical protein [Actinacidiphila sp. DG2A-62]MEC3996768.1 hypothetical protein [Actinacidiphila sp. DG2A-62]